MRLLLGLGALGLLTTSAFGQASFTVISSGRAEAITPDGAYVVGRDGTGTAFRWDAVNGALPLFGNAAVGVSADGLTVLGDGGTTPAQPSLWNANSWTDLGGIPGGGGCPDLGTAYALSDDGMVATGLGWNGCSGVAFRWTAGGGMTALPVSGPNSARGNAISGNGVVIGGWDESASGQRRASIWLPNGTQRLVLANTPGNAVGAGEVWGISTTGTYVVGQGPNGAFSWTNGGGAQDLGLPAGASNPAAAMGVSDDGSVVVGTAGSFFSGLSAFIWTQSTGIMLLDDYVTNVLGLTLPTGMSLQGATDITPDGRTIVGYGGSSPFFPDAFVLRLPEPCGWTTYGDSEPAPNVLQISGGGSSSIGGTFEITTTGLVGPVCVTTIAFDEASFSVFGGTGLIDFFGSYYGYILSPIVGGSATASLPLPPNPSLVGGEVYFQSVAPDAAQPQGWALSNGLLLTICP